MLAVMAHHKLTHVLRSRSSRTALSVIAGQVIGGIGILIQFVAAPEIFAVVFGVPFPPGLVYIAGAAAIVWLDQRSTWSPVGAMALSLWIVFGGLVSGDLTRNLTSPNALLVAGNIVMVVGLLLSCVAGAVAIARNRQVPAQRHAFPLSARNPRRAAIVVTVALLVLAGGTLAAAEQMEFRGGGPYPFLALAIAVAVVPGRSMVGLAIVFSIVYLGGAFSNPEPLARLANPSEAFGFGATVAHLLTLIATIVAGIVANLPSRAVRPFGEAGDGQPGGGVARPVPPRRPRFPPGAHGYGAPSAPRR